jgi:hypothetical protein
VSTNHDVASETEQPDTVGPGEARRLGCDPRNVSTYSTDPSEPPPGVTLDGALAKVTGAKIVESNKARAVATATRDGRVVSALVLLRWNNGSWYVGSGSDCRGE